MPDLIPSIFRELQPARSFNGTNQHISRSAAVVAAVPFTMACWFNPTTTTTQRALIAVGSSTNNTPFALLTLNQATAGRVGAQYRDDANATGTAQTSTAYTASAWHHGCAVFAAVNSRSAYLNGGGKVTETTNAAGSFTVNRTSIGSLLRATASTFFSGSVMWPCVWNVALFDAEVKKLATGTPPWLVRPQNIVAGQSLRTLYDPYGRASWTNNSAAPMAAPLNLAVPGPKRRTYFVPSSAAALIRRIVARAA